MAFPNFITNWHNDYLNQLRRVFYYFRKTFLHNKKILEGEARPRQPFQYIYKKVVPNLYLGQSKLINMANERVASTAAVMIKDDKDLTIISIMNYVIVEIEYNKDVHNLSWEKRTAANTLKRGYGVCADIAILTTALLRASNIPARVKNGTLGNGGGHAWVEVYYDGNWKSIDPTLWDGADREWSSESVQNTFNKYIFWEYPDTNSADPFRFDSSDDILW